MNTFSFRVRCLIELTLTKLSVAAASVGDACGPVNGNRLQYGADHVRDSIDGSAYQGFTQLIGLEARQYISERSDMGLHCGLYLNLRVKFDQDTFDLNDREPGQLQLKRS